MKVKLLKETKKEIGVIINSFCDIVLQFVIRRSINI